MIDMSDYQSMLDQANELVPLLFDKIEEYGGYVARDAYLHPDDALSISSKIDDPWIKEFFGAEYHSWDDVCIEARDIAFNDPHRKCSDAMKNLANNFRRQATPVWLPARHNLAEETTMTARLRHLIDIINEFDKPVYNKDTMSPEAAEHYLNYIYKYSPLSQYCPDIWMKNLKAYGEKRKVSLSEKDIDVYAQAVVALQRGLGVLQVIEKFDPYSIEDTQSRASKTNPTAAHSLPCMSNGKSDDARKVQVKLAYDYKDNFEAHGNVPFVGQRRIQQGGNVLKDYFKRIDPYFNPACDYPTPQLFDQAIDIIAKERPWISYYCKSCPNQDKYTRIEALPGSERERQRLVDNGVEDELILEKFKDGTWKVNFKVSEPNPWKVVSDDESVLSHTTTEFSNIMLSKNRVVFAGSNPVALNKQSFVHKWLDIVREEAPKCGHRHLVASWQEPEQIRRVLTNMVAAIHGIPDSDGIIPEESPYKTTLFGVLSGDDKSSFDNFQAHFLHALFNCCILTPIFKKEYWPLLKHMSVETSTTFMATYEGLIKLSEIMPSGEGATNMQDGFISALLGLVDISLRTGISPQEIMNEWAKKKTGLLDQGDDYQAPDQAGLNKDDKQANAAKAGVILHPDKSLICEDAYEYVRQFSDCNWRVKDPSLEYEFLAQHAPLSHAHVKIDFGEYPSSKSPAIDEISQINRLNNLIYHPRFVDLLIHEVEYTAMGLGTKPLWYVPLYNTKEWRQKGSPSGPSPYHVWIDSPLALSQVAAKEAESISENLASVTDTSWQAQFSESDFNELRIVKILNAIQKGDNKMLNEFRSHIIHQPIKEISRLHR